MDVAFTRHRVAVFVDGCFWHGCPEHFISPIRNREWWLAKIDTNRRRDADTNERLSAAGWTVVRLWEHIDAQRMADLVERHLLDPSSTASGSPNLQ